MLAVAAALTLGNLGRTAFLLIPGEKELAVDAKLGQDPSDSDYASSLGKLADLDLFGRSDAVRVSNQQAEETQLDLTLLGSLALSRPDASDSRAFIADGQNNQAVYQPGDELPGGAKLAGVYPDHVVLSFRGRKETLNFPDPDTSAGGPGTRMAASRGAAARNGPRSAIGNRGSQVAGSDMSQLRKQYQINPGQLARDVQVLPYLEQGRLRGVRLKSSRNAALLQRMGIRTSDIITKVNGLALDDPSNAARVLDQLNSSTTFSVDVRRGGKTSTLNIDLNG